MSRRLSSARDALAIALLVALDQATKACVAARLEPGLELTVVPGLLNLTYVRNRGAAWGILQGWGLALAALAVAILVVLAVCRRRILGEGRLATVVFVLLFAGIAGNSIDRVFLGHVVDFIDFFRGGWHFPAFNVADSCICAGAFLYMAGFFISSGGSARGPSRGGGAR